MKLHIWLIAYVILAVPIVAADDPLAPVVSHLQDKAGAVQKDPSGFIQDHANHEAVENEAAWATDYGCARLDHVEEETGVDAGRVVCPRDPDVAAGAEEQVEEAAEPLRSDVEELTADVEEAAESLVEEVTGDPSNAVAALSRFLEAVLSAIVDAVTRLVRSIEDFLRELGLGLRDVGLAVDGLGHVVVVSCSTVGEGIRGVRDGISSAAHSVADAVTEAVEGVSDWVQSILEGRPAPPEPPGREPVQISKDPLAPVDDLLGSLPVELEAS